MNKRLIGSAFAALITIFTLFGQDTIVINSLKRHVEILASDSLEGRGFGYSSKNLTIDYITREFTLAGFMPIGDNYLQTFVHREGLFMAEGSNIVGIIEGSDSILKSEYIVIGAHFDHLGWKINNGKKIVYNGADDNASGVASVIEIGKSLMARKANLKRSVIIVAFDGEEAGLKGSSSFLSGKILESSKIKTMFSLDMVGMYEKNGGLDLNGMNSIKNGENFVKEIAVHGNVLIKKTANSIEMRTDSWSFAKQNIPAIHVTTGTISPYHKPEDDNYLLDYSGMTKIVDMISSLVFELAKKENLDPNLKFISHSVDPKFRIGYCMSFGDNHHFFKNTFYNGKKVFALETGIISQLKLSNCFILQPEITYELTGSHIESGILRMNSLSPQLDILVTTPNPKMFRPTGFLVLGGFYRYNFAGMEDGKIFDFTEQYYKKETGIKFGLGFQFMKFQMSFYYKYGLNKINRDNQNGEIRNRSNFVSFVKYF